MPVGFWRAIPDDVRSRWRAWRRRRAERRLASRRLDELFSTRPDLLRCGRLRTEHRHRVNILEIDADESGEVQRILFGIIRHPKAHPLAVRGEEVLELLEYRPVDQRLSVAGSRNLTRQRRRDQG
ncbi:MAG: hypothetical protein JSV80_12460 [Acidobacteriota bacterium]|nr:MAG: hypothetical protein JSV80_12460 [Acidobacteriota bacterium]